MRVFKTKKFARFCRKSGIDDGRLLAAVGEIESGLVDADLGGGVFKQRIARPSEGKSGGFRTILLMRHEHRTLFVKGFAKKDVDNISSVDLEDYRMLAETALTIGDELVELILLEGDWLEIEDGS